MSFYLCKVWLWLTDRLVFEHKSFSFIMHRAKPHGYSSQFNRVISHCSTQFSKWDHSWVTSCCLGAFVFKRILGINARSCDFPEYRLVAWQLQGTILDLTNRIKTAVSFRGRFCNIWTELFSLWFLSAARVASCFTWRISCKKSKRQNRRGRRQKRISFQNQ